MKDFKNKKNKEIKISEKMVDELIGGILRLEQENLYIRKHGLKEEILKLIKSRIK